MVIIIKYIDMPHSQSLWIEKGLDDVDDIGIHQESQIFKMFEVLNPSARALLLSNFYKTNMRTQFTSRILLGNILSKL